VILCILIINEKRGVEKIYEKLIRNIFPKEDSALLTIKKAIVEAVFYHDLGKINPFFQKSCVEDFVEKKKAEHSIYSYYLLLLKNSDILNNFIDFKSFVIWSLFKAVSLHHMNLEQFKPNLIFDDLKNMKSNKILKKIISENKLFSNSETSEISPPTKKNKFKIMLKENITDDLFFLIKLFYSHLVLSDFFGTLEFTKDSKLKINKVTKNLKKKFNKSFFETRGYNKKFFDWEIKKVGDCSTLNDCRMNLLVQASQTLAKKLKTNNKIFMLNVPTGGGKTNIAIKLMLDILNHDETIDKVFWVFPYINIIEQNFEVIKKTLSINNDFIAKIHSNFLTVKEDKESESLTEEFYIYLDTLWLNYPVNVISNVNFFNSFVKGKKKNRYKSVFLVNSIVIIDEIQSLPVENIDFFYRLIEEMASKYNMYFIIMSATLPDLNLFTSKPVFHLIENYGEYFSCEHFCRNNIIISEDIIDFEQLKKEVKKAATKFNKVLIVLNTISSSIELFESLKEEMKNVNIFLLNSLIFTNERNKIIEFIKKTKRAILVSTQSIEAGVDIDFDCGFRDFATIDSIEQVAGRINRESDIKKRKSSFLRVFVLKDKNILYRLVYKDYKMKVQEKNYMFKKYNIYQSMRNILKNKKFQEYYEEIRELMLYEKKINGTYNQEMKNLLLLNFKDLSSICIIKERPSLDLYVSLPIGDAKMLKILKKIKKQYNFNERLVDNQGRFNICSLLKLRRAIAEIEDFLSPNLKKVDSFINNFKVQIPLFDRNIQEVLSYLEDEKYVEDSIASENLNKEILKSYTCEGKFFYYIDIRPLQDIIKNSNLLSHSIFI